MTFAIDLTEEQRAIKHAIEGICAKYDDRYWLKTDESGNIDMGDLRAKAGAHHDSLSALMVTYPSTHGVFESTIR